MQAWQGTTWKLPGCPLPLGPARVCLLLPPMPPPPPTPPQVRIGGYRRTLDGPADYDLRRTVRTVWHPGFVWGYKPDQVRLGGPAMPRLAAGCGKHPVVCSRLRQVTPQPGVRCHARGASVAPAVPAACAVSLLLVPLPTAATQRCPAAGK